MTWSGAVSERGVHWQLIFYSFYALFFFLVLVLYMPFSSIVYCYLLFYGVQMLLGVVPIMKVTAKNKRLKRKVFSTTTASQAGKLESGSSGYRANPLPVRLLQRLPLTTSHTASNATSAPLWKGISALSSLTTAVPTPPSPPQAIRDSWDILVG